MDSSALMEVQHATPAEGHNCVRRRETARSTFPVRKQLISMFFSTDVCAPVVVALLLLNTGRVYKQQTAGTKKKKQQPCNSSFILTAICDSSSHPGTEEERVVPIPFITDILSD